MTVTATPEQIPQIVAEAQQAAHAAAQKYFTERLGGRDQFACGFAWVNIYKVKGNTRIGRALKQCNIRPSYSGGLQMWNPSNFGCQNVDTLEEGARAAAEVFKRYGFEAYAGSRLD
jgi:predicted transcriptional regulator of viral defense system